VEAGKPNSEQQRLHRIVHSLVISEGPPPVYTPNYRAVTSTGTIRVVGRSSGHVQLQLNLAFTDASGQRRTVTGNAQANTEKSPAICN